MNVLSTSFCELLAFLSIRAIVSGPLTFRQLEKGRTKYRRDVSKAHQGKESAGGEATGA